MRILSQDGFYDLPYDSVWLRFDEDEGCTIYAIPTSIVIDDLTCDCKLPIMGEYSTEAKARKAMEMLRVSFENYDWIKSTGNSEELKQVARILNRDEFEKMTASYFQFPADDEVEV